MRSLLASLASPRSARRLRQNSAHPTPCCVRAVPRAVVHRQLLDSQDATLACLARGPSPLFAGPCFGDGSVVGGEPVRLVQAGMLFNLTAKPAQHFHIRRPGEVSLARCRRFQSRIICRADMDSQFGSYLSPPFIFYGLVVGIVGLAQGTQRSCCKNSTS